MYLMIASIRNLIVENVSRFGLKPKLSEYPNYMYILILWLKYESKRAKASISSLDAMIVSLFILTMRESESDRAKAKLKGMCEKLF